MATNTLRRDSFRFLAGPLGYFEGLKVSSTSGERQSLLKYFGRRPKPLPEQYRYGTYVNPGRFTNKASYCPQPIYGDGITNDPFEEDCLQLNIYIPGSESRPEKGWPVFFFIHGGFLQWGSPNMPPEALAPLLSETALKAIVVMPGYRLNLLGFLASKELQAEAHVDGEAAGNIGFWDQRLALEWTSKHIGHFGGDANNITVGGYSAGAHSTFHQLAHEVYAVPDDKAIIRRAIMWYDHIVITLVPIR